MDKIAVLIPCYNEAKTVEKVVKDFKEVLPEAAIYVYDNNSTDDTAILAERAGAVVRHEYQQGKEAQVHLGIFRAQPLQGAFLQHVILKHVVDRQRTCQNECYRNTQSKGCLYVLRYSQERTHTQIVCEYHIVGENRADKCTK